MSLQMPLFDDRGYDMQAHNLHVPLPEDLHAQLRAESDRTGQPATELAREGIRMLLVQRERQALNQEIAAYAAAVAGTEQDLDTELEAAAVDHLLDDEERSS
jgi:plasmid stability protein